MSRVSKNTESRESKESIARAGVTPAFIAGVLGLGVLVIGGAILLGRSDGGQINISQVVDEAQQAQIDQGGEVTDINVPSQAFQNMPNGGLVPSDNQTTPESVLPETEVSSSTQDVASSTPVEEISDSTSQNNTPTESSESDTNTEASIEQ